MASHRITITMDSDDVENVCTLAGIVEQMSVFMVDNVTVEIEAL